VTAIVIVGAGECGTRAAFALREQGWDGNSVAKDIKLAEMLIARRAAPEPAALADPGVVLKSVLRSPVAG
jgi:predicted NAD/FAD-dependent oxidoreductase